MKGLFKKIHRAKHAGSKDNSARNRWGIILAGGDGTRLRSLTKLISGDERPKQFCRILDEESLLEKTVKRVEIGIPRSNILLSLTRTHEKFYSDLFDTFNQSQLVVQPANLGTAPAILYGLVRIARMNPEASVTFFPSDHYLSDDGIFMRQVESAFEGVEREPGKIVLLGITSSSAETEYGWIEPEPNNYDNNPESLTRVRRFWEKPEKSTAVELLQRRCLWNSFVMTGKVSAFLNMISTSLPGLYHDFMRACDMFGTPSESDAVEYIYEKLTPSNFSHRVLEVSTKDLMVLAVRDIEWSDLGEPGRVLSTMENIGIQTYWTLKKENLVRKIA